jgi:nicotinamide-nucleotide amidase
MTEPGPVAGVLAVGDELLRGEVIDGNAAVIGAALDAAGVPVIAHAGTRDREAEIAAALEVLLRQVDVVVVSGGLGPTQDDRTREGLARAAGVPLVSGPGSGLEARQGDHPLRARTLDNPRGTAPGLALVVGDRIVYALPGVPHELAAMLTEQVLPDLAARFPGRPPVARTTVRTVGVRESRVGELMAPFLERCQVAFLAEAGEVRVVLTGADSPTLAAVRGALAPWSYDGASLEAAVVTALSAAGQTVACAESLTAGLLAGRIAAVPGASAVLRGGIVAYATDVKASLLGVPADVLAEHGAVSEACARAMAAGAAARLGADHAMALTGVAGPTEQEGHPPGTVCLGLHGPEGTTASTLQLPGDRARVRTYAVTAALAGLLRALPGSGSR